MKVEDILPKFLVEPIRFTRNLLRYIPIRGAGYYCPICKKYSKRFWRNPETGSLLCLYCSSLDRHRITWLYFERMTNLFNNSSKRMLHIAPAPSVGRQLKKRIGSGYISVDANPSRAMIRMDITDIQFSNESFDAICCSHVLEHVSDDKRAMREIYRVLKFDGYAILLVPISAKKTFEDPSVTDPSERLRLFGQEDHARRYGPDFVERLEEAGFDVKIVHPSDFLRPKEIMLMGITRAAGDIYHCTKRLGHTNQNCQQIPRA
jgi:SAM-dependent methyltransferase